MSLRRFVLSFNEISLLEQSLTKAGFSELAMMESVASGIVRHLQTRLDEFSSIVVLAGPGNNGADGCAVLRLLLNAGCQKPSALISWPGRKSPAREVQERLLGLAPGEVVERLAFAPAALRELRDNPKFKGRALVIDAVFGAGFKARAATPEGLDFMTALGSWVRKTKSVVAAVDVASGLDGEGHVAAEFYPLRADLTFCIGGPRLAQLEPEGADQSGRMECVDLGVSPATGTITWVGRRLSEVAQVAGSLDFDARRLAKGAHKNTRGRVAVVGGSLSHGGATRLAAETALRFGAGYATLFESEALAGQSTEVIKRAGESVIRPWPKNAVAWQSALGTHEVIVFGCGLPAGGVSQEDEAVWKPFFKALKVVLAAKTKCRALVVDGGGLVTFLKFLASSPKGMGLEIPVIFTPHPKEASDMLGVLGQEVPRSRLELYRQLREALAARGLRGALLLKGAYPLIGSIESEGTMYALDVASPRLATAGSGDVLSGAVAGAALTIHDAPVALFAACAAQMRAVKHLCTGSLASEISAVMGQCWQEEIRNAFRV